MQMPGLRRLVLQCFRLEGPALQGLEGVVRVLRGLLQAADLERPPMLAVHLVVHDARGREPAKTIEDHGFLSTFTLECILDI